MQLIRGVYNIKPEHHGCVLTIGNFDGVHLGHQQVIKALVAKAKALNSVAAVMVFEPQPQEFFSQNTGQAAPARLTRLRDKYVLLAKLGVERLICVNFNQAFASQSAQYFIEHLLVDRLGIKHLIIGDDFKFGRGRQGDFKLLCDYGQRLAYQVADTASYRLADCRVSSTAIRQALLADDLASAESMLGRPYSIIGRVVHGDKNGRKFGFPTANVLLKRQVSPVAGVYVVKVVYQGQIYYGVANIGTRPTLAGVRQQLEVHVFDFSGDLYSQTIEVVLLAKLRQEKKFASIEALTEQIQQDSEQARVFIRKRLSNS